PKRRNIAGDVRKHIPRSVELIEDESPRVGLCCRIQCDFLTNVSRSYEVAVGVEAQRKMIKLIVAPLLSFPYAHAETPRGWRTRRIHEFGPVVMPLDESRINGLALHGKRDFPESDDGILPFVVGYQVERSWQKFGLDTELLHQNACIGALKLCATRA